MKATGLPADQQFFADLFSGPVLNPQLLGRVWFASQPASLPVGSLCIDFPRLDIVLRGEYGNLLEAKQQRLVEGEMLFIPARAANLPVNNKPVMLLSGVCANGWDYRFTIAAQRRCCILLAKSNFPACNAVKVKRCSPPSPISAVRRWSRISFSRWYSVCCIFAGMW